jgi:hypothetical protein
MDGEWDEAGGVFDDGCRQEEDCYIQLNGEEPAGPGQSHVHEFVGSTELAGEDPMRHNHRFAGISGEAIYVPGSHVHRLAARTDFFDHYHDFHVISGPATFLLDSEVKKSDRKHVHFAEGATASADSHVHRFEFATLVEAPLFAENKEDRD